MFSYWSEQIDELFKKTKSTVNGLTREEALQRYRETKTPPPQSPLVSDLLLLLRQFKSPLLLILVFAVILATALGEYTNSFIILGIILLSGLLGFWQERTASHALQKLRLMVQVNATVLRSGRVQDVAASEVVPGDIVFLNAGDIIPGDAILLEANDLHVNEAGLTGESFPVEKLPGILAADTPLSKRKNCVFQGTSVLNGTAKVLVINTGNHTEFGKISTEIERHQPVTSFESGVKNFGFMIMRVTILLSLIILTINIYLGKPVSDSILFALALAVGMAPELLPAIVTVTLSAGAKRMATKKVIVKKLSSIQNLGAVNIFCSDKTGTLTEGIVKVQGAVDGEDNPSERVKKFAYINATFESGFTNPLDEAIRSLPDINIDGYEKLDEVPFDFIRKRLSIAVNYQKKQFLVSKGAVKNILEVCDFAAMANGETIPILQATDKIKQTHEKYSTMGFRTIGISYREITGDPVINKDDEIRMTFLGFIVLADSLKAGIIDAIQELKKSGIVLKLITGDNSLVASCISKQIGLKPGMLTGSDLRSMSDEALAIKVNEVDVFAETEPNQKERLVRAMQKGGNVVGYIGDGINDASAIKAADVGISVDTAVDVAKETADIVLLEKDLNVLREGILEGRKTFINTLKYIFITTSANFGNMISVAISSFYLPFLPLLPKQILLLNLLSDLPAMAISSDRVDEEQLTKPRKWDTRLIRNFMIVFGIESSLFDLLTFGVLLWFYNTSPERFQTGWFLESVATEILILLVIRTQRPFLKSRPGKYLLYAVLFVGAITVILPYIPYAEFLGLAPLPWPMMAVMISIALLYAFIAEFTKRYFFKRIKF